MNAKIAALVLLIGAVLAAGIVMAQSPTITRVATGLQNPRGVAVLPDDRLLVAEAGVGRGDATGRLSVFSDANGDGDYDDPGEIVPVLTPLPSYNIMVQFNPGRDEVLGIGDVLTLDDGRAFFTLDDHFAKLSIVALDAALEPLGDLVTRDSSLNAIAYDSRRDVIYVAESSFNDLAAVTLDGAVETVAQFGLLAHNQQAVPAGVAVDPISRGRAGGALFGAVVGLLRCDSLLHARRRQDRPRQPRHWHYHRRDHRADDRD